MSRAAAYRAAWIFPVAAPPVRNGILEVDPLGRVAAIHSGRDHDALDLGGVALVPALVNAHVHLEFSDLAAPIAPPHPFPAWISKVVSHRHGRTEPVASVISRGIGETALTGTAALGEISTTDNHSVYPIAGPELTLFRELIGPLPEHWPALLEAADRHLSLPSTGQGTAGLSPHAPYTVPQELFEKSVDLAALRAAPVAVHLAETAAERELLASGTGELVEMMRSFDLWRPELHPRGRRPLDWLRILAFAERGLVIHGNHLDDEELDFLATHDNLSLVYCPRTHAYFDRPPHPFRRLLDRGGRVALGTDGRSSNPDLDLWLEATFLRTQHPDLPSDTILDLVTRRGAESLGVADRHGCLAPGRQANFLAVRLADPNADSPPDLFAPGQPINRVFRRGSAITPLTSSF